MPVSAGCITGRHPDREGRTHLTPERTLESQRIYEGRILNLRVDTVELAGSGRTIREIVEHGDAVAVVAVLPTGEVLMVSQFRKAVEADLLEIPAGGVEAGEVAAEAARRELQEETGFLAGTLEHLATFYTTPGFSTERIHAFLATSLTPARLPADEDETIDVLPMPMDAALARLLAQDTSDAKSLVGLLLARDRLENGAQAAQAQP